MSKHIFFLSIILLNLFVSSSAKESPTEPDFCSNQILAHPIKNGYTWTLTTRLGKFLGMAEDEYGERDKNWTILGVDFSDSSQPKNWHPFDMKKKNIIIQLTKSTASNEKEALFQLAHEVFHVLSPTGGQDVNYLEEGLATYFSIKATRSTGIDISADYIASPKYRKAHDLVEILYEAHPDTGKRIAAFRQLGLPLTKLDQQKLMKMFPNIEPAIASQLAESF